MKALISSKAAVSPCEKTQREMKEETKAERKNKHQHNMICRFKKRSYKMAALHVLFMVRSVGVLWDKGWMAHNGVITISALHERSAAQEEAWMLKNTSPENKPIPSNQKKTFCGSRPFCQTFTEPCDGTNLRAPEARSLPQRGASWVEINRANEPKICWNVHITCINALFNKSHFDAWTKIVADSVTEWWVVGFIWYFWLF